MIDKTFKDVIIGYNDHSIGDCEFSLNQFDQNEHAFDRITYYRTDTQIIWNKQSRIDLLFNSGDTRLRIKSNPKITNLTLENAKNMPLYVRKYILQTSDITDNDQSDDECSETSKNEKSRERVTHFLSIRIKNPLLIALATEIQNDIIKEYKKQKVRINTSLIKEIKFHISINVISLPTDDDDKFIKILEFIQHWLHVYIFEKEQSVIDDNVIFMQLMKRHNYFEKMKKIYDELQSNQSDENEENQESEIKHLLHQIVDHQMNVYYVDNLENDIDISLKITNCILAFIPNETKYSLYFEGVNHFNQRVIFLDFENKCIVPSDLNKNEETEQTVKWVKKQKNALDIKEGNERNEWMLKLIRMIFEMIVRLSDIYNLSVNDTPFIPHCTIMKISFLKRNEMKKLIKHNKENKIKLMEKCNDMDNKNKKKKKRRRRNDYKVYDAEILSTTMNRERIDEKIHALKKEYNDDIDLSESISQIDFCAMHGANETEDGYYKVLHSLSIIP